MINIIIHITSLMMRNRLIDDGWVIRTTQTTNQYETCLFLGMVLTDALLLLLATLRLRKRRKKKNRHKDKDNDN